MMMVILDGKLRNVLAVPRADALKSCGKEG